LRIVVMVWLVGGLVFFLIRFASGRRVSGQVLPQQATTALTAISTEDLLHHMESVNKELAAAAAKLHRAEDHISLAIPSIKRNYLLVEKGHLESAAATTEAARRELEQSRQEFEVVLNSLKKEHQLQ
jgi:hypothetical protein